MKIAHNAKIDIENFKRLYYVERYTLKEMTKFFNCAESSLADFRKRNDLPVRAGRWANGHPLKGKYHTAETRHKISMKRKGKNTGSDNPMWKGGKFVTVSGYRVIKAENHPFAYKGYIREHRLVMEQNLGRYLSKGEEVHHRNGDKLDNRIENLVVLSASEHAQLHQPKGSRFGKNASIHS
jgi:uncharacterized protein (DUF1330 family)